MNNSKKKLRVGDKFNRLMVLKEGEPITSNYSNKKIRVRTWMCICDCGNKIVVRQSSLKYGNTKSCGCYRNEKRDEIFIKHGQRKANNTTPEYNAWVQIKQRCYNEQVVNFKNYGGRGIIVCDRWLLSFDNFFSDMGVRPTKEHSIDRVNNDGNYEPSNCRWATEKEQQGNKRNNTWYEYDGEKMILMDWAKRLGVVHGTLNDHLKKKTFTEVVNFYKNKTSTNI